MAAFVVRLQPSSWIVGSGEPDKGAIVGATQAQPRHSNRVRPVAVSV